MGNTELQGAWQMEVAQQETEGTQHMQINTKLGTKSSSHVQALLSIFLRSFQLSPLKNVEYCNMLPDFLEQPGRVKCQRPTSFSHPIL